MPGQGLGVEALDLRRQDSSHWRPGASAPGPDPALHPGRCASAAARSGCSPLRRHSGRTPPHGRGWRWRAASDPSQTLAHAQQRSAPHCCSGALHRHKAHGGVDSSPRSRLRESAARSSPLDVGLHILRRHELPPRDRHRGTAPSGARLNASSPITVGSSYAEKAPASGRASACAEAPRSLGRVHPIQLEDTLRRVDENARNLVHGRLPSNETFDMTSIWHIDAVRGPSHPS